MVTKTSVHGVVGLVKPVEIWRGSLRTTATNTHDGVMDYLYPKGKDGLVCACVCISMEVWT